ncbi:nitroreductase family deazaflavin-dependent oxidoreductase [Stackebrandtia soli]|uniref:nitroreductase family deazaflavin-dependent oxidoreductase n=1 Tax=Stackebrandtia soli TaxID=1892856 RepID=UPI0039EBC8BB
MRGTETDPLPSPSAWVADQARLYEESDGAKGTTMHGAPCLLLDHQGRTSGDWHRTVLIYGRDGDDFLIVASNGGAAADPAWYRNLVANPRVRLRVGARRFTAVAETLSPDEKRRVWPHLVEVFAPYAEYERKTERDIPVIRLRESE